MKNILIVVDMQTDFVDGALGTAEAVGILENAAAKIRDWDGPVITTLDTHYENYLDTAEGKKLPVPHCIRGTQGWALHPVIAEALKDKEYVELEKYTFGAVFLPETVEELSEKEPFTITLIGLCTDICVVSNALLLKASFPEVQIAVDAACCAGVTPALHAAALDTMRSCQIDIL